MTLGGLSFGENSMQRKKVCSNSRSLIGKLIFLKMCDFSVEITLRLCISRRNRATECYTCVHAVMEGFWYEHVRLGVDVTSGVHRVGKGGGLIPG